MLLVALGGALGSVARFELSTLVMRHAHDWRFPAGTFAVNVVGCFAAGLLAALVEKHGWFAPETRTFLFVGILGGFTTFSAFSLDFAVLWGRGDAGQAAAYAAGSVIVSLVALFVGLWLVRSLA